MNADVLRERAILRALKRLVFAARTSGGTPGPDAYLMAACDEAEALLSKAGESLPEIKL